MQMKVFVTLAILAFVKFSSAQSDAKISLLDRKFRTRVSLQDTAFTFGHEIDGVELGCYGYIKDGRPFKMYYVFDEKDYRFITTTMRFQVHPPSGKKRFAILTPRGRQDKEKTTSDVLRYPEECL
ncbi:CLUMA_CG000571, isoform A [Clunio marinus]|uniref:CLUMA_CG000571, isoform A n=1 Tax=Clunio marinus TaxID=568069 RepID=A0A1J1HGQ9_9DIPT|nr:CLUMA_CG000571, isoform A [Clunio marinus]